MQTFLTIILTAALLAMSGCTKYDDSALRDELNALKERVAQNEQALQALQAAVGIHDYVTGVETFDTPAPGGCRITLLKDNRELTIWNRADDDALFAADGVDNTHADYVTFTLADGSVLTLPRYVALGIAFELPGEFAAGETKAVPFTTTGGVTIVKALAEPGDWNVSVSRDGAAGTFSITAPEAPVPGVANVTGEVTVWLSDGADRTVMRAFAVRQTPVLAIDKTAVNASGTAGAYAIVVISNAAWTAAVNVEAGEWCTTSPVSAAGNGTLTVNVAANPATTATRAATVTVTAGALQATITVGQALGGGTPPYAASPQTWLFGEQTWSDAIHIPECENASYTGDYDNPHCLSYTSGTNTWYYYNWAYVNANAATLCPSPWRVPAQSDFSTLVSALEGSSGYQTLINEWGYGGFFGGFSIANTGGAYHWSATEHSNVDAYYLEYSSSTIRLQYYYGKYSGMQVRCVR
jgi:uncharacterized protein (TIGR02145 family)